jgi:hypothetical protein
MANRRLEMYHYRQALVRMRQGESDRQIHATGLMGRRTLGTLRKQAQQRGWLDPARALPSDQDLAAVLQRPAPGRSRVRSSLEPYRQLIEQWCIDGIDGTTIHAALKRRHGYGGSYSVSDLCGTGLKAKRVYVVNYGAG